MQPANSSLEHRTLLAGTVNVAFLNGALTLTALDDLTQAGVLGLKNDNVIVLTSSAPGVVTLSGVGETFALAGTGPFNGVTSIKLDLKEGNDSVTLSAINVSGALTVLGGEGNTSVAGGGALASVTVTNGDGNDTLTLTGLTVTGAVTVTNGEGNSSTNLTGANFGSLRVTNLDGFDTYTVVNSTVTGTTSINNGLGGSTVSWVGGALNNSFSLTNGDGANTTTLAPTSAKAITILNGNGGSTTTLAGSIVGAVSVTNGEGRDSFSYGGTSSLTGNLTINNKGGGSTTTLGRTITGNVSVTGLSGKDEVLAPQNLTITGTTTLSLGNGDNSVNLQSAVTLVLGGRLSVTGGDGNDEFKIKSPNPILLKGVAINWGLGDSQVEFDGNITMDDLSIAAQNGEHQVDFKGASLTTKGVTINFTGGSHPTQIRGLATSMTVNGNLLITSANGVDNIDFGQALSVTGTTTVTLGGGGSNVLFRGSGTLTGKATITGNTGNDSLTIQGMTLTGGLAANPGSGQDLVAIDNSVFKGTVILTLGSGADQVNIEQLNLGTETRFEKAFTVNGDGGADIVNIGRDSDPNDFARFFDAVAINGGTGIDRLFFRNLAQDGLKSNLFGIVPAIATFEVVL